MSDRRNFLSVVIISFVSLSGCTDILSESNSEKDDVVDIEAVRFFNETDTGYDISFELSVDDGETVHTDRFHLEARESVAKEELVREKDSYRLTVEIDGERLGRNLFTWTAENEECVMPTIRIVGDGQFHIEPTTFTYCTS